jgi:hypothetical protein
MFLTIDQRPDLDRIDRIDGIIISLPGRKEDNLICPADGR